MKYSFDWFLKVESQLCNCIPCQWICKHKLEKHNKSSVKQYDVLFAVPRYPKAFLRQEMPIFILSQWVCTSPHVSLSYVRWPTVRSIKHFKTRNPSYPDRKQEEQNIPEKNITKNLNRDCFLRKQTNFWMFQMPFNAINLVEGLGFKIM